MASRDLVLHGPARRALVTLAGPVIAGEALHAAFHLVDVALVGPLGAWATGAIMTSMFTLWISFALSNLVVIGLGAQVSRAIGAGDRPRAAHVASQAFWLSLLLGIPVGLLGAAGAGPLFELLVEDPLVREAGSSYLRIFSLGTPVAFLCITAGAVMRATGNTRTPLIVSACALLANGVLATLLIYGPGPFPALGVAGSAVATVLAISGAVATYAVLALRGHPDLPVSWASLARPDFATLLDLARVGAPYCAVGMLFSGVYLWYAHLASGLGTAALAVLGIGNRLESLTYLTADGFGIAASTFVGQNLGAGNPARARHGAWTAALIMTAVGSAVGLLFALAPQPLLHVFTRDAAALALGVAYLRVLATCQPFTALEGAIGGGFAGAGDTVPPMVVHVAFAAARIPLASWAVGPLGMGLLGIAWTMSLTCIVRSLVLAAWFRRDRWMARELPGAKRPLPPAEEPVATV